MAKAFQFPNQTKVGHHAKPQLIHGVFFCMDTTTHEFSIICSQGQGWTWLRCCWHNGAHPSACWSLPPWTHDPGDHHRLHKLFLFSFHQDQAAASGQTTCWDSERYDCEIIWPSEKKAREENWPSGWLFRAIPHRKPASHSLSWT